MFFITQYKLMLTQAAVSATEAFAGFGSFANLSMIVCMFCNNLATNSNYGGKKCISRQFDDNLLVNAFDASRHR